MKYMHLIPQISFLIIMLFGCSAGQQELFKNANGDDIITYQRKYDAPSNTYYYLTRVKHQDKNGKMLQLQMALSTKPNGETVPEFSNKIGTPLLAMNASMGIRGLGPDRRQVSGRQIIDGVIAQDFTSRNYTLGIKDTNELVVYPPEMTAQDILDDGTNNALTCFVPLIVDYKPVGEEVLQVVGNNVQKHPRQVIAQLDNLDLLILSCGGRGFDGEGMTAEDMIRILLENKVKFAVNLDGGGSVSTVIRGELITKKIDNQGTEDRPRSNLLYNKE